jgi:hypothetical protein
MEVHGLPKINLDVDLREGKVSKWMRFSRKRGGMLPDIEMEISRPGLRSLIIPVHLPLPTS